MSDSLPKTRLLIVEDNPSLQQMLTWEFEDLGYEVTATGCCSEAIEAIKEGCCDLALLDYNLPDGCGTDLMNTLLGIKPDLPVILCSGRLPPNFSEHKAYCFAPKPVSAKNLHQLFQKALTNA